MIKRVKLFPNSNNKSILIAESLYRKLESFGYDMVDDNYDLAIAIGGDGSFLRMVKATDFNDRIYYIILVLILELLVFYKK